MSDSLRLNLARTAPVLFVILWSTGFIGARYAMPYASPFGFLTVRFVVSIALLGGFAVLVRAPWPKGAALWSALATGILIHAVYLAAIFWAVKNGFPAGFAGLIVGLQPVMTALMAALVLGDRVTRWQWIGLLVGLCGVGLVLAPKLTGTTLAGDVVVNGLVCVFGVIAFSLGTVLQKRFGGGDNMAAGTTVQYAGAGVVCAIAAVIFEPLSFVWSGELIFAFAWLVLVLSVGAIVLLMFLIRVGEVARVASLFYLVPAVTAIFAYFLFGEQMNMMQIVGVAITSAGVALATLRRAKPMAVPIQ